MITPEFSKVLGGFEEDQLLIGRPGTLLKDLIFNKITFYKQVLLGSLKLDSAIFFYFF